MQIKHQASLAPWATFVLSQYFFHTLYASIIFSSLGIAKYLPAYRRIEFAESQAYTRLMCFSYLHVYLCTGNSDVIKVTCLLYKSIPLIQVIFKLFASCAYF